MRGPARLAWGDGIWDGNDEEGELNAPERDQRRSALENCGVVRRRSCRGTGPAALGVQRFLSAEP